VDVAKARFWPSFDSVWRKEGTRRLCVFRDVGNSCSDQFWL